MKKLNFLTVNFFFFFGTVIYILVHIHLSLSVKKKWCRFHHINCHFSERKWVTIWKRSHLQRAYLPWGRWGGTDEFFSFSLKFSPDLTVLCVSFRWVINYVTRHTLTHLSRELVHDKAYGMVLDIIIVLKLRCSLQCGDWESKLDSKSYYNIMFTWLV